MTSCDLLSYYNHIEVPLERCFTPSSILSHLDIGTFALIWNQRKWRKKGEKIRDVQNLSIFKSYLKKYFFRLAFS